MYYVYIYICICICALIVQFTRWQLTVGVTVSLGPIVAIVAPVKRPQSGTW